MLLADFLEYLNRVPLLGSAVITAAVWRGKQSFACPSCSARTVLPLQLLLDHGLAAVLTAPALTELAPGIDFDPLPTQFYCPQCAELGAPHLLCVFTYPGDACGGVRSEFLRLTKLLFRSQPSLAQLPDGVDFHVLLDAISEHHVRWAAAP